MDDDLVWETHAKKSLIQTDPANKNSFSYLCKQFKKLQGTFVPNLLRNL